VKTLSKLAAVAMIACGAASAADGLLDSRFGNSGTLTVPIDKGTPFVDRVADVLTARDGSLFIVGTVSLDASTNRMAVMHLRENGQLDTSYGNGGVLLLSNNASARAAALDQWGTSIYVAGMYKTSSHSYFYLCRTGALVKNWCAMVDILGATPPAGSDWSRAEPHDVIVLPNGRIVVVGAVDITTPQARTIGLIVRFNSDGTIDTTFGDQGLRFLEPYGSSDKLEPYAVATYTSPPTDLFVVGRHTSNGVTASFMARVNYMFDFYINNCNSNADYCEFTDLIRTADDNYLAVGTRKTSGYLQGIAAKITPGLHVIDGWGGSNNMSILTAGTSVRLTRVLEQSDGKFLAAGVHSANGTTQNVFVTRFKADGYQDDTAFHPASGIADIDFLKEGSWDLDAAMTLQSGQPIIAASVQRSGNNYDFGAARLQNDGIFRNGFELQ